MMLNILVLFAASAGGAIGWWLGSLVGIFTAFLLSLIGTAAATFYARKWLR